MSEADQLFDKIQKMPLNELLWLCAKMLEEKMNETKIDVVFQILEMRLQKRRMCNQLGIKDDE